MRVLGVDWGGARIGIAVGEAQFKIASPRHPLQATGTLMKDALAIQTQVKIEEAEKLYSVSNKTYTKFVRLDNVGHMYGAKHPYKEESSMMNHVINITAHWLHTIF